MKVSPSSGSELYKKCAVDYLNVTLGKSEKSQMFWQFDLRRVHLIYTDF